MNIDFNKTFWYKCGFGNRIITITNILHIAEITNSYVKFPNNMLEYFNKNSFDLSNGKVSSYNGLGRNFYYHNEKSLQIYYKTLDIDRRRELCKKYLIPNLKIYKPLNLPSDLLIIHIRSGDQIADCYKNRDKFNWEQNINHFYSQFHPSYVIKPPCYFYDIITRNGYKNVKIITERDRTNPLISKVYNFCVNNNINIEIQSDTLVNDMNTILNAKHLIMGFSTFPLSLALLSTNLEKLYCTTNDDDNNINIYKNTFVNTTVYEIDMIKRYTSEEKHFAEMEEIMNLSSNSLKIL